MSYFIKVEEPNVFFQSNVFDSSSVSSESDNEFPTYTPNDFIYDGSLITCKEFNLSFMWLCNRLNLSMNKRKILFNFTKTYFPTSNRLPSSYNSLCKLLNFKKNKSKKMALCSTCYSIIREKKQTMCSKCANKKLSCKEKTKRIDAIVYDYKSQIKSVVSDKWQEIVHFKKGTY
jgi:hypothetical protein